MKQHQQGFLLIYAIVMILIMAFIGLILTHLSTNQTNTSTNLFLSKQALYIAISGLEIAKRDITKKAISCNTLGTQHNAESLLNGQFSVTGVESKVTTLLSGNINSGSTSIQLTSATGFAPAGIAMIDSEYIYYASLSGNVISRLSHGKGGSIAASHNSGATISQSQCYIQSTGAIPTINAAKYKNTVGSVVVTGTELSFGGYQPSVSSSGSVSMSGNAYIANPGIQLNAADYTGSTLGIMGAGSLNLSGNSGTKVENVAGTGLVASTTVGHILPDVVQSIPTTPSLYSNYFGSYTPAQLQSTATAQGNYFSSSLNNINSINGVTGEVIYINGSINTSGNPNVTIGSPTAPVVLYVNGSFNASGTLNLTVYGIVYVTGTINLSGNSAIGGEGSLATAGGLNMSGSTDVSLILKSDDQVLSNLYSSIIPGAGTATYTTQNLGIQQIYP